MVGPDYVKTNREVNPFPIAMLSNTMVFVLSKYSEGNKIDNSETDTLKRGSDLVAKLIGGAKLISGDKSKEEIFSLTSEGVELYGDGLEILKYFAQTGKVNLEIINDQERILPLFKSMYFNLQKIIQGEQIEIQDTDFLKNFFKELQEKYQNLLHQQTQGDDDN